ncbi:PQQ-dependent sugar dehydrogenase [Microbacterium sp. 179-I 3D4 NHS]|uniref:PQQ-dependent sugar dehydrogenase n=1 Tax=Microbacterium sp. 179-I 3D4 NHS TaxID=3142381 RepID=UPI0039A003B9
MQERIERSTKASRRTDAVPRPGRRRRRATAAVIATTMIGALFAAAPAAADEPFTEVIDFEQYTRTALNGQDGWTASAAPQVVADPLNGNNQVVESVGGGQQAVRAIPAIAEGTTGTLFFRFLRIGSVDTSFGLTDVDAPNDYVHSRAYVNNQNDDVLRVRDGGSFKPAGVWSRDAWQCVWIVADNATDKVAVYSQGGAYDEITRLPEGTEQQFGFRQAVNGDLDRFFWKNGASSAGRLLLDDVAVDTSGENLAIATGNAGDCAAGDTPAQPLLNPLPDPALATLGIEVTELAQLPASQTTPATQDPRLVRHNRITHLDEVPDGSGRLMVPDNNAILYLVDKETGAHVPYLNVRDEFVDNFHNSAGLGTGLGAAEFHPDFADNGLFYTVHTEGGTALTQDTPDFPAYGNTQFHSVITEWKASDPSAETFAGSHREVMRIPFGGRVHTVQQIAFNPTAEPGSADDGILYILVGDGGNGVGNGNPQDLATPQGKILRIDPTGDDSENGAYGVPDDNPFVDEEGALSEIYAVGMRDPHRISWDPEGDHTMYLAHIGEWQVESIYAVEAGDNFGWSVREGSFLADNRQIFPLPEDDAENGFTYPVAAYDHNRDPGQTGDAGVAVNGGFVYRGEIEALQGRYLFTDLVRGWVLSTQADEMVRGDGDIEDLATIEQLRVFHDGVETTFPELVGDTRVDLRFGSDADGELYLVSKANGKIWKVTGAREAGPASPFVLPELARNLVTHYDFDHPAADPKVELDQGLSGTDISLINGGVEQRVADRAYPGAGKALQTQQMSPTTASNDDWKAGVYDASGVDTLGDFAGAEEISVMGWFKPTGDHPALNSGTANPDDVYNAIGLAGVLTGTSDGHAVRALLEVITVDGELKLVALGRRVDGAGSWTFAADLPWDEILKKGQWVHLAATFDFAGGEMKLFMNGAELAGEYTTSNPWGAGATSDTAPAGIKIGGSFPQNTREANPFHGRMDDVMLLDTVPTAEQIAAQYALYAVPPVEPPAPAACTPDGEVVTDVMAADDWAPRTPSKWEFPGDEIVLTEPGTNPDDGIRRPFEYAVLTEGPVLGSFALDAQVRLDEKASVNNRDVIIVFGWQSDTQYYYAHLSKDNTIYPHNGIFKVDDADRERIDDQWDGTVGAPPAVTDEEWHDVRVVRCAETGDIAVYVDGLDAPLLTANDTTFPEGRVGFGSFDNFGRLRDLTVTAAATDTAAPAVTVKAEPGATVGRDGVYSKVSFKLNDAGDVDRLTLNGVEKDLTDAVWSDLNGVAPGSLGAVEGANTLVVYDAAGNATTVRFTLDVTAPTVTVKTDGSSTAADGAYARVSFKLHDANRIDRLTVNGVAKDLTDNVWSDLNAVAPGAFGAVAGANTLVVYDVAGNATTVPFTLAGAAQ